MKKFLRSLPLLVALLCGTVSGYAIEGKMLIKAPDGKLQEISLIEDMTCSLRYDSESKIMKMVVYTMEESYATPDGDSKSEPAEIIWYESPLTSVDDISFSGDIASVEKNLISDLKVFLNKGTITLSNVTDPIAVTITGLNGITVLTATYTSDTSIDLNRFGKGVYAVKVGEHSFKMLIK